MCDLKIIIALPLGQPHAIFGGLISISGGWMLLCKELVMSEDKHPYNCAEHNILM